MGDARVDIRYQTVLKDFKDADMSRYYRELKAYTELPWAAPRLICHSEFWLETERCTPILDLTRDQSRRYQQPLRALLQRVHDAGWWHGDPCLVNVVIHPSRGPLLIDWENLRPATGTVSADLYGAGTAGVAPAWNVTNEQGRSVSRQNGVWWGGPWPTCPGPYWSDDQ